MHIPDGYLSPTTCAAFYAGSAPFWYVALARVKRALHSRLVPLLSLFSAFCFLIMMFNLPLPGGTTGHAVGMGLAAVVLGPWAAMLAISVALTVQALFFGDGGITALGANCFNMAIIGSLASYAIYRMMAGRAAITSFRRVVAAGLAGYAAINVSALLAAIEFGVQPLWFHDASGTPLYCPYPLSVSIPAMMIGHLTIAGLAELIVSAGLVAFLQRSDPSLLKGTAGAGVALREAASTGAAASREVAPAGAAASREVAPASAAASREVAPASAAASREVAPASAAPRLRPLWIGAGFLMILTPLGMLAVGSAWGEWMASDFSSPAIRQQIAASSLGRMAPALAPRGLEQMSRIWTAPFAGYAPPYIQSAGFGYFLSAMFGAGFVILASILLGRLLRGFAIAGHIEAHREPVV